MGFSICQKLQCCYDNAVVVLVTITLNKTILQIFWHITVFSNSGQRSELKKNLWQDETNVKSIISVEQLCEHLFREKNGFGG